MFPFSHRKYLFQYFGSNTSHILQRAGCCDNCDRILMMPNKLISEKYENIADDGKYDFTENGL